MCVVQYKSLGAYAIYPRLQRASLADFTPLLALPVARRQRARPGRAPASAPGALPTSPPHVRPQRGPERRGRGTPASVGGSQEHTARLHSLPRHRVLYFSFSCLVLKCGKGEKHKGKSVLALLGGRQNSEERRLVAKLSREDKLASLPQFSFQLELWKLFESVKLQRWDRVIYVMINLVPVTRVWQKPSKNAEPLSTSFLFFFPLETKYKNPLLRFSTRWRQSSADSWLIRSDTPRWTIHISAFVLQGWGSGLGRIGTEPLYKGWNNAPKYVPNQVLSSVVKNCPFTDCSPLSNPAQHPLPQLSNQPLKKRRPFRVCVYRFTTGLQGPGLKRPEFSTSA